MTVGIEAIHFYGGQASVDVRTLFERRGLNLARFDNLMMRRKAVALPCEDPVTHAVNAAKPIVAALSDDERSRIEMVITASESGLDFGKSLSTYVHDQLGLSRNCRLFEVKQACYGGTAAFQMAAAFVASKASPGAKVLVIATDTAAHSAIGEEGGRAVGGAGEAEGDRGDNFAEPSSGTGAVALLVGDQSPLFELDFGASGCHSYEVMDTCRPVVGWESGDSDLSLASYLDCLQGAFEAYCAKVADVEFQTTFDLLAFHTPFPGMVKGAHRKMTREQSAPGKRPTPPEIEADFERRVLPSLRHCVDVGNLYSGSLYLALCGVLHAAPAGRRARLGLFSYGSGCSSEFFSGIVAADAAKRIAPLGMDGRLAARHPLEFAEYERITVLNRDFGFGANDRAVDIAPFAEIYEKQFSGKGLLVLKEVRDFHRVYGWS